MPSYIYIYIVQSTGCDMIMERLKLMVVNYMCKPDHLSRTIQYCYRKCILKRMLPYAEIGASLQQ